MYRIFCGYPCTFVAEDVVHSLSHAHLFATPWTAARQASLSITISQSLLKLTSIQLVMPSNHLILCRPLLLPPSIFPSIRDFSKESVLPIRGSKDWSFSLHISPSNEHSGLMSLGWTGWISLQSKGLSRDFSNAPGGFDYPWRRVAGEKRQLPFSVQRGICETA